MCRLLGLVCRFGWGSYIELVRLGGLLVSLNHLMRFLFPSLLTIFWLPIRTTTDDWRHVGQGKFGEDPSRVPFVPNNFFTDIRIHQIREMQEQVARTSGIPSFDFGDVWEGWQFFQEKVHPALVSWSCSRVCFGFSRIRSWCWFYCCLLNQLQYPGGPVFAQSLIHHIWLESQGRENWSLNQKRPLSPTRRNTTSSHTTDSYVFLSLSHFTRL